MVASRPSHRPSHRPPHPCRVVDRSKRAASLLVVGLLAAGASSAQVFSVGVAGGFDRGRVDCVDAFRCDRSSGYGKLSAGWRIADAVELQASYFDAGRFRGGDPIPGATGPFVPTAAPSGRSRALGAAPEPGPTATATEFGGRFDVRGFGLTAGYRGALGAGFSAVARGGAAVVRTNFDYEDPAYGSVHKTRLQPLVGAALDYDVTPTFRVGLDYDLTRFKVHTQHGRLQLFGVSAHYAF